mgnify:CR=1 FL=1
MHYRNGPAITERLVSGAVRRFRFAAPRDVGVAIGKALQTLALHRGESAHCHFLSNGVLVGFGTRYASGCTSGHAITGMSTLQLQSLFALLGIFGGERD